MIKKKIVLFVFLLFCFTSYTAKAFTPQSYRDNSCLNDNTLVSYLLVQLGTMGYQLIVDEAFRMKTASNNNCNNFSDNFVNFEFGSILSGLADTIGIDWGWDQYSISDGDTQIMATIPFAVLRGKNIADKNCVQILTLFGFQDLGCKYYEDKSKLSDQDLSLYGSNKIAKSCSINAEVKSQALFPITSRLVQCTVGTLDVLFDTSYSSGKGGASNTSSNAALHNNMKVLVKIMLTLTVVIFGLKVTIGNGSLKKNEIFMLLLKMIFVVWFSIGIGKDNATISLYNAVKDTTSSFSGLIQKASSPSGLCQYDYSSANYGTNRALPLFDALDCRLLHYLMIDLDLTTFAVRSVMFIKVITTSMFSFQLLFCALMIIFAVFFLSAVVFFTCFYLVCSIIQAILIYFSPIFVPCILFNFTKDYFTAWVRALVSYSIQPAIIMVFISLMLTLFDQAIYGNCQFKKVDTALSIVDGRPGLAPRWELTLPLDDKDKCINTIGWQFSGSQGVVDTISLVFFNLDFLKPSIVGKLLFDVIVLVLLSAILYGFSTVINGFAADLSGGSSLESVVGQPNALAKMAGNAASKVGGKLKENLAKK